MVRLDWPRNKMTIDKETLILEAKSALDHFYPDYELAFLAGSLVRGEGHAKSDLDIVILYGDDFDNPHRASHLFKGRPIEFFVQTPTSLEKLMKKDRERGVPTLAHMVMTGLILPEETPRGRAAQDEAKAVYEQGPPAYTVMEMQQARYMITDLLDDLEPTRNRYQLQATIALLHNSLGDFYCRAQNQWSGKGKNLIKRLKALNPDFGKRYCEAFDSAYRLELEPLISLAEEVLEPYGGRNFDRDYQKATIKK